jgi:CHAT domain-containing protein
LTFLGHAASPTAVVESWPRVWWCPTGPASLLPLHAAGKHPRTGIQYARIGEDAAIADSVAGRVVSSYTPTLAALARARARPAHVPVRALIVGVPDAPNQPPLPGVLPELEAVAAAMPMSTQTTYMISPTDPAPSFPVHSLPVQNRVVGALPQHSWLHLSCHGSQHSSDASRSAFWLYDGPLTLAQLAALHLPDADLAYLAACQTATGDVRLVDEALHLAAGLQLVGFRHVLATLWSISDTVAPGMAQAVYSHLAYSNPDRPDAADRPDSARMAYALHRAVTQLRQLDPSEPLLWAPYIHLGP